MLVGCVDYGEVPPQMKGAICGERNHKVANCVWQGRLYACTGSGDEAQCAQVNQPVVVEGK